MAFVKLRRRRREAAAVVAAPVHALHACVSGPLFGAQVLFCPAMTRQGDHGYDRDSRYLLGFVAGEESIRTLGDCDARWLAAEYAGVVRLHRRQDPLCEGGRCASDVRNLCVLCPGDELIKSRGQIQTDAVPMTLGA